MKNLNKFFNAKSIAVIGVSRESEKVGHVIFKNLIDSGYEGNLYPITPNAHEILGHRCYGNVTEVKGKIELAVIAISSKIILKVIDDCGKKKIKNLVIITAGFGEIGNTKLEEELKKKIEKYNMQIIGPNCLGVLETKNNIDCLFLPNYRMQRPKQGGISFVTQSGAVGSAILDHAVKQGLRFAKFVSYGNALNIDESDLIEYLGQDKDTKVICVYVEGVKNGKKFLDVCRKVSRKKPIIAIKGGVTEAGAKATLSHTGSLAGSAAVFYGVCEQANVISAKSLEEMFDFARMFDRYIIPKGNRIQVVTNGGGYGVLAVDAIHNHGLKLADMRKKSVKDLKKEFADYVVVKNPIDLTGDASTEGFEIAIKKCLSDSNIDIVIAITLLQTPMITPKIVDVLTKLNNTRKKPIIVVTTGSRFVETIKQSLEENKVPCFTFPENAVNAIKQLVLYAKRRR